MTDSLGTARLDLTVDTTEFEARISRAKNLASGFGSETENAFNQATGKAKTAAESLLRYVNNLGLSVDQTKLLTAAIKGVDAKVIEAAGQKMKLYRDEVEFATAMNRELTESFAAMQVKAKAANASLKFESNREKIEADARAVQALAAANELLAIKQQHAADGEGFKQMAADAERARRGADAVAALTQRFNELEAAERNAAAGQQFVQQLQAQAAAAGLSKTELLELKAAELGVASSAAPIIQKMRDQEAATIAAAEAQRQLAAAEAQTASNNAFVASLQQQAAAIGKTRAELLELKAAELGVSAQAAPFIAQLKAQEKQITATGIQFNQYGLSAKQTAAALRQVPAQMTDIFVSLQSGQNPLTVLLQQGGQLKDVFGGVVPAARALGSAVLGLVNPFTVSLAALGGLVAFELKAEQQTNALNRALILSGNVAGQTAEQLNGLARQLDDMQGVTAGSATAALTEVVGSGLIAEESYEKVTRAALAMEVATGKAVKETVASFAELQRDPVNASLKLNETTHYLTESVLSQIQAMQEQGDMAGAAALAISTAADDQIRKAGEINESLGLVTGAWHNIKTATSEAADGAVQYFVDLDRDAAKAVNTLKGMFNAMRQGGIAGVFQMQAVINPPTLPTAAKPQTVDSEAARQYEALHLSNLSKEEKQQNEILRIKNLGIRAGKSQADIDKDIAASNARYAESLKKPKSTASTDNAQMKSDVQQFKDQLAIEQDAIQNSTKILQANFGAKKITIEKYYADSKALLQQDTAAQEKALTGEIAVLKSRNATGKDAINVQRELRTLEIQLAKVRADGATAVAVLGINEATAAQQRVEAIEAYKHALDQSTHAMELQNRATVAKITMGDQEYDHEQKLIAVYEESARKLTDLAILKSTGHIDQATYDAEVKAVEFATDAQVRTVQDGYDEMLAAQADWLNGVNTGLQNWLDQTANVAGQISAMVGHDLDTIADGFANAAETGKLEWRKMLIDMLKELEKFLIKQAILKAIYSFAGSSYNSAGFQGGTDASFYANGDTFSGSPSLSKYSGQVVNQPTPFYFAHGAGVMGEAGPEAIMPLKRGSDGKLGVRVNNGEGKQGTVNLSVTTIVNSDGSSNTQTKGGGDQEAYKQFSEKMRIIAQGEVQRQMKPGGLLWRAGVTTR